MAGDSFNAVKDDKDLLERLQSRQEKMRKRLPKIPKRYTREAFSQIQEGSKGTQPNHQGDVQGSVGAIISSCEVRY